MKKLLILLAFAAIGCNNNKYAATVMITNLEGNSGGSGTIVETNSTFSEILTNKHVCGVVEHGGQIITTKGSYVVSSYRTSEIHDLCLIRVTADLEFSSSLSNLMPQPEDKATIYGHPHLMPTIITEGFFSEKLLVPVQNGVRECTEKDKEDHDSAIFCMLFGKLPSIKMFEAVVVSALIQPGSSGSAIYMENNKIGAVVFAGSGDLGWTIAVPFEYIYQFLNVEVKMLPTKFPNMEVGVKIQIEPSPHEITTKMVEFCKTEGKEKAKKLCQLILDRNFIILE